MAKTKLYCAEHKRTFQGGQGYAAHLRRFHPTGNGLSDRANEAGKTLVKLLNETRTETRSPNGKPATIDVHTHLDLALVSVNAQIKVDEDHLTMLRSQREHIAAALGADYIPF